MTDEHLIESSQKLEEQMLQHRIHEIKNRAGKHQLKPNGKCYDCGEKFEGSDPLRKEKKFCDDICEGSWREWFEAQKRKHGPNFRVVGMMG